MLYMIIQAARSLLAAFFHVFKSHISKLKPIGITPDRLYFRSLIFFTQSRFGVSNFLLDMQPKVRTHEIFEYYFEFAF